MRPHVEPSFAQGRRCIDFVAQFVDGEHLPLRGRFENGDLAFRIREEDLKKLTVALAKPARAYCVIC